MTEATTLPLLIAADQTEPLANGLWGSVSRVRGTNMVVKVAKDEADGMFEIEKAIYERLGASPLVARYLGVATVATAEGKTSDGLLLQYYPRGSLKEFLNSPNSAAVRHERKQQLRWAAQILRAVRYLHEHNIVHGDVAIHNMAVEEGEDHNVMLMDFGGSSLDGADMRVECSPRYHRPHSWRFPIPGVDDDKDAETWKTPTRVADTFALGTVLFEVFTGAQMYLDETYDQIRQHATQQDYPDLAAAAIESPEVRAVIARCWLPIFRFSHGGGGLPS